MTEPAQPVRVRCLLRDQHAHVRPVEEAFGAAAEFVYDADWDPAQWLARKPDLVLCVNDYPYEVARCLEAARQARIPSLVLQDGILEWRCQYENPLFGAGGGAPQHQPVLADKIACLGPASARHLAAWSNTARVEVTGMPRLDHLLDRPAPAPRRPGTRLLVMTAKNPGFTPEQRELTLASLRDLKRHLDSLPQVQVLWRVSKSVATALGVENQLHQISSLELARVVEQADAAVTTLSTAILEVMLLGRPVAALDYHNAPRFQATAWTISAPQHIPAVIGELLQPPAAKLAFQQVCLADSLECAGPATQRVRRLMQQMVSIAQKQPDTTWEFPPNLLGAEPTYSIWPRPPLGALYPQASVFRESSVEKLQLRLGRAEKDISRLKAENAELRCGNRLLGWIKQAARKWGRETVVSSPESSAARGTGRGVM